MHFRAVVATIALVSTSSAALAAEPVVQPVQVGQETVRFDHAVPTLDLQQPHGAIQVTPLPMDHGALAFGIAVYNGGDSAANFDITNVAAHAGTQDLPVMSRSQLESKAKHRAMWASIALAAAGGLSAAAAASTRDHYRSTLVTPHGTYHASFSAPSVAGQVAAAGIAAGTGVGLANIQAQLDQTRAALGESTVQLTTIDPRESYAGRIVLTKIKDAGTPQRVDMIIRWNGEDYPFAFRLAKAGTPMPEWHAITSPAAAQVPAASVPVPPAPSVAPAAVPVTAVPAVGTRLATAGGVR